MVSKKSDEEVLCGERDKDEWTKSIPVESDYRELFKGQEAYFDLESLGKENSVDAKDPLVND